MVHQVSDNIGKRLHAIRTGKNLCLRALASQAGVSSAMICMIENGKVNPSTGVLLALARALQVTPVDLLGDEVNREAESASDRQLATDELHEAPNTRLIRAVDRQPLYKSGGVSWFSLASFNGSEFMEISLERLAATAQDSHPGVETCTVLAGQLLVTVNEKATLLNLGDSLTFPSTIEHTLSNPGETTARILWIHKFE